ncbi:lamin tail domain-containing protein [Paenibacillus radicis (ex Xue et al. 2023)]|uniref:Lamin tail domain-containing protein n=1 Tax=Paenibacillus radicis (ex Xue et al. 2023) TaxID=2972489 RepID=A0ABT1YBL0_9BACL|nr:lamin tail domain-containing protein [Paenibacillus radicis (ex Xue et al. 2023)]MCR8629774.1 lamin tail domain-containing protein [Paenibacillus radicis (ex Xue et al. 2023)]
MKHKFKQAVVTSAAMSLFAASALIGIPAVPVAPAAAAPSAPAVLITELVPDSINVSANDAYEYVELYNATDQAVKLSGYKLRGKIAGVSQWEGTLSGNVSIPPRETILIWTQNTTITSLGLKRDQFRSNYGISASDLPDNRIHILQNVSGLYNGSPTQQNVSISLVNPLGNEIVSATYFIDGQDDTFENKGISFKEPSSGIAMVHNGGNKTATPGRIASDEVPGTAPSDAIAVGGDRSLTLSWTPNNDSNVKGYRIYSQDGLPSASVTNATYTFTGMTNGTDYMFTLSSVYNDGHVSPASLPVSGRAGIPAIPANTTGLQALPRDGAIRLSWDASPGGDVSGYRIYKNGVPLPNLVTGSSYAVPGLTNGQSVTFAVYTVNQTGLMSAKPAVVAQKPQAAPSFLVTEMTPNSKNIDYKTGGTDAFEFIELHNTTSTPINIKGFKLKYSAVTDPYPITEDKIVEPQGTFIIWFKNTNVQQVGLTEFNLAYGSSITEDKLFVIVNGGMSNTAARGVKFLDPDNKVLTDTTYNVEDVGESISANFIPNRSNGVVSTERFSAQANPGYLYPVQKIADPADTTAPAMPSSIQVTAGVGGVKVAWSDMLEPDVAYVFVYVDGVVKSKLLMPQSEAIIEGLENEKAVSLQVSAVDTAGRESVRTTPIVATPTADAMPALLITEVVPDTWNTEPLESRDVYDAYEFVELYNPHSQPLDLNGKTVRFTQPDDALKSWSWTFNKPTLIEPRKTLQFWVRPNGLNYLKADGFNFFYYGFQEAKYVPESAFVYGDGAGGLANGGGIIDIVEPNGTVLVSATYTAGQFLEKKGITYAYPMFGGNVMRISGLQQTGTPGVVGSTQIPRESFSDQIAPAAPAGFQVEPGPGSATINWLPNVESDLAGYKLYMNDQLELTLPAAAVSYKMPALLGEVATKFELSAIDQSGNESTRVSATIKPTYMLMTQVERDPSPANALTHSRYQAAWDIGEKGPIIPGLVQGHVPQGMSYYKDDQREWLLMAAYHYSGDPSTLAVVDAKTGVLVKYVNLKNPDGTIYTGHAGGVAVSRENVWLSSGKKMYRMPIQTLIDSADQGFAQFADSFGVVTNSSFTAYDNGMLWVGEYSNPPAYTTDPSHQLQNRYGETHLSWIAGYELDSRDQLPSGTPSFREESMDKFIPKYVISIGDKIQGIEFNKGEILLTYNQGRSYNSILRYTMPQVSDLSTKNAQTMIGGVTVPVWLLDGVNKTGSINIPTGAENMFIRNVNGADHLYINFESGANHSRYMSAYSMDRLLDLNLDQLRLYDTRTLAGVPQELKTGAEAQASVLANRGKNAAENVTSSYTWVSSEPSIVEVTANGHIRGIRPGTATITGTSGESVLKASIAVAAVQSNHSTSSGSGSGNSGVLPTNPTIPTNNPAQQHVTPDEIKAGNGAVKLKLAAGKTELAISESLLKQMNGSSLEIEQGNSSLVVAAEALKAAAASIKAAEGSEGQIIVTLKPTSASLESKEYKAASGALSFGLSVVNPDGIQATLEQLDSSAEVKIKVEAMRDSRLLGLYSFNADGSLGYIGGKIKDGMLTAQLTGFGTYVVLEYSKSYSDVPPGNWAHEALQVLAAKHVAEGIAPDTFAPNKPISRAEFTALLVRAFELPSSNGVAGFTDVASDAWYNEAVGAAAANGLIQGVEPGRFAPNEPVSREQMAVLLVRAWERKIALIEPSKGSEFKDSAIISNWAADAVSKARSAGLLSGKEGDRFDPTSAATRAESAQAIFNALFK